MKKDKKSKLKVVQLRKWWFGAWVEMTVCHRARGVSERWRWGGSDGCVLLPHDAHAPLGASALQGTCHGSPWDGPSRTWRFLQSPPGPPPAGVPWLLALTYPRRTAPPLSGGPWSQWSPPPPPGWTWSWPSCWSICARCPGGSPSCRR